jgi:hypothetical protein
MRSPVDRWAANHVAAAKTKGLGVFGGLNRLDGGNRSSGFRGNQVSCESEVRPSARRCSRRPSVRHRHVEVQVDLLRSPDIKTAMKELATLPGNHIKTSCRQWQS